MPPLTMEQPVTHLCYDLLTTTRYDPTLSHLPWNDDPDGPSPYFLLPYHYERLQAAARHLQRTSAVDVTYPQFKAVVAEAVIRQVSNSHTRPEAAFRVRITLGEFGELQVTATPLDGPFADDPFLLPTCTELRVDQPNAVPSISVYIDKEPTVPSLFTSTKTTFRKVYDEARLRNGLAPLTSPAGKLTDVLLHNTSGLVMETSIFNVAFRRGSRWLTPRSDTGCLPGVARRWLIEHERIDEDIDGTLTVTDIIDGELVLLFNGVQGCRLGKIVRS